MADHPQPVTAGSDTVGPRNRMPINVLFGISDQPYARIHILERGKRLSYAVLGTASIVPHLSKKRFAMNVLYLHPGASLPSEVGPGPLLNHVGDPDLCGGALSIIERIAAEVPRPCFNPPAAIARSTRDGVARALAGLPGLDVPKTIRIPAERNTQVMDTIDKSGLHYPLLVRVAGEHGGEEMVRVDGPENEAAIRKLTARGRDLYATEFRDFVSPDGLYRKARIVIVGEEIYLRQHLVGDAWLLHLRRRAPNTEAEEIAAIRDFDSEWAPRLRPLFREMGRRMGLDFFGVDCNISPSGTVTLFEANACMLILKNTRPPPNMWDAPIARILAAVEDLIATPERWRDYARFKEPK